MKLSDFEGRWEEREASEKPFPPVVMAHLKMQTTRSVRGLYERGYPWQNVLELFRELGREESREEGRELGVLLVRFQRVPESVREAIEVISDAGRLERRVETAARVEALEQFARELAAA